MEITLYTKTICPKCLWVKSELQRAGLNATIRNIEHDEEAKKTITDLGYLSVPILQWGDEYMSDTLKMMQVIEESQQEQA